jgi:hypothetical protein
MFHDVFKALIERAFNKGEDFIRRHFKEFLMIFWENSRIDFQLFQNERLENPGDAYTYTLKQLHL